MCDVGRMIHVLAWVRWRDVKVVRFGFCWSNETWFWCPQLRVRLFTVHLQTILPWFSQHPNNYNNKTTRFWQVQTLIDASKEVGLEVNTEKTKYMSLSRQQNAGRNHDIKIANRCFENVAQFRYLGTTITNQNLINSVVLVRNRTIPTERPQPVGEVSANFSW
jgi:hypothetical protein